MGIFRDGILYKDMDLWDDELAIRPLVMGKLWGVWVNFGILGYWCPLESCFVGILGSIIR